jgi:hypothetical protein
MIFDIKVTVASCNEKHVGSSLEVKGNNGISILADHHLKDVKTRQFDVYYYKSLHLFLLYLIQNI